MAGQGKTSGDENAHSIFKRAFLFAFCCAGVSLSATLQVINTRMPCDRIQFGTTPSWQEIAGSTGNSEPWHQV